MMASKWKIGVRGDNVLIMIVKEYIKKEELYRKPDKDEYHRKNKKRSDNWWSGCGNSWYRVR